MGVEVEQPYRFPDLFAAHRIAGGWVVIAPDPELPGSWLRMPLLDRVACERRPQQQDPERPPYHQVASAR